MSIRLPASGTLAKAIHTNTLRVFSNVRMNGCILCLLLYLAGQCGA